MKRSGYIIAVTLFAIFAVTDIVREFITNDPVHFFSEQPRQLLVVAAIAIVGGMIAFFFYRLSPHRQRKVKLLTLGSAAGFVTLCGVYFGCEFARLSAFSGHTLVLALFCIGVVAALLWFEFYQIFRTRAL